MQLLFRSLTIGVLLKPELAHKWYSRRMSEVQFANITRYVGVNVVKRRN